MSIRFVVRRGIRPKDKTKIKKVRIRRLTFTTNDDNSITITKEYYWGTPLESNKGNNDVGSNQED